MPSPRIDLPPEAVALYEAGASIAAVAATLGYSYERARRYLVRAGVELRRPLQPERTQLKQSGRCRDCGEDLDRPHVLGSHIPGCEVPL